MTVTIPVTKLRELEGVHFDRKTGATCPRCGFGRPRVHTTRPWDGGLRIRFHQCQNCGTAFKSLETEGVGVGGPPGPPRARPPRSGPRVASP